MQRLEEEARVEKQGKKITSWNKTANITRLEKGIVDIKVENIGEESEARVQAVVAIIP